VKEAEYIHIMSTYIMFSCMKMEKWDLLKLLQELGEMGIKENDGGGEFNYDIF
jgi:hypothetical protein